MNKRLQSTYMWLVTHRAIFEKCVFPIMLFFYPFIGVFKGVDVSDTTYALGGFLYPEKMQSMWKLSTYLHQQTGRLILRLPFGETMLGTSIYTTLIISLTATVSYYLLQKWIPAWMIFIGEWIAVSLCWCPHVIMYNYLTYMLFTFGMLFLVRGLSGSEKSWLWLLFAGICLGLNVTVRLPNVMESAAVVIVIAYDVMVKKKTAAMIKEVLTCFGGFIVGFLVPFTAISLQYGTTAYADMITALFEMSKTASQYSGAGMLSLILSAYRGTFSKMVIMLPCIVAGIVMFSVFPDKFLGIKRGLYIIGLIILTAFYFESRVFTRNYWYYDSFFQAGMMFLIISLIFYVIDIIGLLNGSMPERLMSMTALFMILILPIGSNNYTYPVFNSLFLIAPVSMGVFRRIFRAACGVWSERIFQKKKASIGKYFQNEEDMRHRNRFFRQHFTWVSMATMVVIVLIVQGTLFRFCFVFRDGVTQDGRGTCPIDTVTVIPKLTGMQTTSYNAKSLNELYDFVTKEELKGEEAIFFGDIPGLSYILDLPPAIFSTWPDLDSVLTEDFDSALMSLEGNPLIIIKGDGTGYQYSERKYNLLMLFIRERAYTNVYDDGTYRVYKVANN